MNRNATLCYQGCKGGNKPRSETRSAAALQHKMGWSADCPRLCPPWPALALQPVLWTPPSQPMWQFPWSQSTIAPFSEPQPCHKAGPGAFALMPLQAGSGELLQQSSQQGQETCFVPALLGGSFLLCKKGVFKSAAVQGSAGKQNLVYLFLFPSIRW